MEQEIDLQRVKRNLWRAYVQDGLADMLIGGYLAVVGLAMTGGRSVAPWVIVFVVGYAPLLRWLKTRFTYPRTGYAALREGDPRPLPQLILGSLVVGLAVQIGVLIATGAIGQPALWYRWLPIGLGIFVAGLFLGMGLVMGVARYYVVAAVALIGGPAATLPSLAGKLENIGVWCLLVGSTLLAWGLVLFIRFLRAHPRAAEESNVSL